MHDVVLIVDQYQRHKSAIDQNKKIDPDREAEGLSQATKVLGRTNYRLALVAKNDDEGFRAYGKAGFQVKSMNGERPNEIMDFIVEMSEYLATEPPKHLVVVTDDPVFQFLFQSGIREKGTKLAIWVPGSKIPKAFNNVVYDTRLLEELLPDIKVPKVDVRLDYENFHYGLKQRGRKPHPKALINDVKAEIADLGDIVSIIAYADWSALARDSKMDLQRELALIGVKTRYQVNLNGKNSADMEIANDIRTLVERDPNGPDSVDVIVVGTGDRDFRPTVETAKARGKQVVVLALEESLSRELKQVASEVRYLDSHVKQARSAQPRNDDVPQPTDEHADLVTQVAAWLHQQQRQWASEDQLLEALAFNSVTGEQINQAIEAKLLTRYRRLVKQAEDQQEHVDTIALNREHPLVKTVCHLIEWAPDRVSYCLETRGMPYVDSNFLAKGMTMDRQFQRLGVGQNRWEAEEWLELLNKVGLLEKKLQPHPKTPAKEITTWWLPEESQLEAEEPAIESMPAETTTAEGEPEDTFPHDEAGVELKPNQATPTDKTLPSPDSKPKVTPTRPRLTPRVPRLSLAA